MKIIVTKEAIGCIVVKQIIDHYLNHIAEISIDEYFPLKLHFFFASYINLSSQNIYMHHV